MRVAPILPVKISGRRTLGCTERSLPIIEVVIALEPMNGINITRKRPVPEDL
jgi:hypothetical protein